MSVDLAARLLRRGTVPEATVRAALQAEVLDGVPLIRTLSELGGETAAALERELARSGVPLVHSVRGVGSLVESLPLGMCERLMALPVRLDARTGIVDVAAADPTDPHIVTEFEHALQAPVRAVRATPGDLTTALADLTRAAPRRSAPPPSFAGPSGMEATPAYGTPALHPDQLCVLEEPAPAADPIPLVRAAPVSNVAGRPDAGVRFKKRPATNPGIAAPLRETFGEDESGDPVIGLYRSKPPAEPPGAPAVIAPGQPPGALLGATEIVPHLEALDRAVTPDDAVEVLVRAMSVAARLVAVFVVRAGAFQGRAGNARVADAAMLKSLVVPMSTPSVFETAVQVGYYLGPLPATRPHRELARALGDPGDELYLTPAVVSGHPVLVLLAAGLVDSYAGSRWADQLVRAAGAAFARMLRGRKRD